MKKTHSVFARVLGFAAAGILAATVAFASPTSTNSYGTDVLSQSAAPATGQAQPAAPAFDGKKLYKEVFNALRDRHFMLTDPAKRAAWVKEWENKHATDKALDTEESTDKAVLEMIQSLGQRFDYYKLPEANQAEQDELSSTLVGIGAQLNQRGFAKAVNQLFKDAKAAGQDKIDVAKYKELQKISDERPLIVVEPMEDSPAIKVGIKAGDRITKVDGVDVNGKTTDEVIKTIRGKDGTVVKITVTRDDGKGGITTKTFDITRGKVVSHVVKFKDLGDGVSYVQLTSFMSQFAEKEMFEALTKAAKGKALVLDLRGNPGGRLDAAETIGQMILDHGVLNTLKQRNGDSMVEIRTVLEPDFSIVTYKDSAQPGNIGVKNRQRAERIVPEDMPIVVLVDGGSASASEILSGLLQHNKRAIVVGKTTVGKGVGQNLVPLPFNRNIHVTSFEFLPGGAPMDWIGIIPDIDVDFAKLDDPEEARIDWTKDSQMVAAKKAAQDLLAKAAAAKKQRDDIRSKNEADFQKELDEARKAVKP